MTESANFFLTYHSPTTKALQLDLDLARLGCDLPRSDLWLPNPLVASLIWDETSQIACLQDRQGLTIPYVYSSHFWSNLFFKKCYVYILSFGQVTKIFGLLYLVMFPGLIRSSFFGHLNNPRLYRLKPCWNQQIQASQLIVRFELMIGHPQFFELESGLAFYFCHIPNLFGILT